ncbi:hypothetical protein JQC91_00225 [Jannaschia sp. Os4]|uniref:hypothetical protein n=1 Tax=Jannaschia sp. Os4 TaxID=2807617 RepID=UPI0019392C47|nr:hypothetical protein [Jannaschia sp. Os4]MBM2574715.1 hypothetical protein [Jannaschia sp. Os4]
MTDQSKDVPRDADGEPKIHDADRPSETAGQPSMGDGASGARYLKDVGTGSLESDAKEPVAPSAEDMPKG